MNTQASVALGVIVCLAPQGNVVLGEDRWKQVLDELHQADEGLQTASASVQIEHRVQRPEEDDLRLVIKSNGKVWFDSPCYRVELNNEVRLMRSQTKPVH